ncbi:hypothetical protein [Rhodospirillum sp. A1_3_36]|uniref:hypothetical protein n=1 Tax=Rhodospirillum sp. A1_3_36 TaxID=3391666 RepID=UPI0039A4688C
MEFFRDLRSLAFFTFLTGAIWLIMEDLSRSEVFSGHRVIDLDFDLIKVLIVSMIGLGFAIRPRVGWRGEFLVAGQVVGTSAIALFCLPSAMLIMLFISYILSLIWAGMGWIGWAGLLLLASVFTLALWVAGIAAVIFIFGREPSWPTFWGAAIVVLIVYGIGSAVADHFHARGNVLAFSLVSTVYHSRSWIPGPDEVARRFHELQRPVDNVLVIATITSSGIGIMVGVAGGLILRAFRQQGMRHLGLRGLIPIAAAPLPDDAPWLLPGQKIAVTLFLLTLAVSLLWNKVL